MKRAAGSMRGMSSFIHNNGLSLVLFAAFIVCEIGLSLVGWRQDNDERRLHGQAAESYGAYIESAAFLEATMENWESEFLQMFAYVVLTVGLYQRGSAESKAPAAREEVDADPRDAPIPQPDNRPWPVKKGGLILTLYEYSLGLALFLLFAISFALHVSSGAGNYNERQLQHGQPPLSALEYMATAQFWFESLQNWQSEFFSIGMMVLLTIVLRQRGSPESKPVAMPHRESP